MERVARFRLELGVQVRAGYVQLLAQISERDVLGVMLPDVLHHGLGIFILQRRGLFVRLRGFPALSVRRSGGDAPQTVLELVHVHGLEQVFRHTQPDGLLRIVKLAIAGDDDRVKRADGAPLAQHFQPVHIGHADIGDDDIRAQRFDLGQALLSGGSLADDHAVDFRPVHFVLQSPADQVFILHQQNLQHPSFSSTS